MASARRPYAASRHHAQSRRRRHIPVRRRHRAARIDRRYDALIKVQSETLDHLAEAVAVFGSDGRVRLHNPAFQRMWKLSQDALEQRPHVEAVTAWCQALHDDNAVWRNLRAPVTAIDNREPSSHASNGATAR